MIEFPEEARLATVPNIYYIMQMDVGGAVRRSYDAWHITHTSEYHDLFRLEHRKDCGTCHVAPIILAQQLDVE